MQRADARARDPGRCCRAGRTNVHNGNAKLDLRHREHAVRKFRLDTKALRAVANPFRAERQKLYLELATCRRQRVLDARRATRVEIVIRALCRDDARRSACECERPDDPATVVHDNWNPDRDRSPQTGKAPTREGSSGAHSCVTMARY